MDTIRSYLDNLFAGLPRTERVRQLRIELLSNMEEHYRELKAQGKTENEAVGIVISQFGNIDELLTELNIQREDNALPEAEDSLIDAYLEASRKAARNASLGVFLCILGPALLILFNTLFENGVWVISGDGSTLALIPMFLSIVSGVGSLIYGGTRLEPYKTLETEMLIAPASRARLQTAYEAQRDSHVKSTIAGVCLCVISPVPLFALSALQHDIQDYGVPALLLVVACGVYILIRSSFPRSSYEKLLKIEDYTPAKTRENKVVGAVASVVWPLAVALFLFLGFVYHLWGIAWIIFPITGLLFGIFSSVYTTLRGKDAR